MKFKKYEIALMIILGVVIIVAGIMLFLVFREYSVGEKTYDQLQEYAVVPDRTPVSTRPTPEAPTAAPNATARPENTGTVTPVPAQNGNSTEGSSVVDTGPPTVDFASLQQQNPDIIGWIYSAGTPINYPVVQGESNEEYLYRMANRTNNRSGSIFLDCQNDSELLDENSILHGHNMSNGSMFAELLKYSDQKYYNEHPRIWLVTPEETYSLELFAGFVTASDSEVWKLTFPEEEDFTEWKSKMVKYSYFQSQVTPQEGEKVMTLSTCTYDFDGARFVVMGVLR